MKSEAFHFAKSFEHSPKASKPLNYIVFNDFNVKKMTYQGQKSQFFKKMSNINFDT